ncbi:MAG TPA: hypothetical protein VG406_00295 [Isosphaeraceae bacterium]|jgi:hypothetical protein|nr:hypothetical protein [Isosphaeraceae bacterium]
MKTVTVTDSMPLAEVFPPDATEGVVLMRDGHAFALLVPFDDEELLGYVREHDPELIAAIARGREQVARGEVVSHEQLMRELEAEEEAETASKAP